MAQVKDGMAEWNTLSEEQKSFIHIFFMSYCSKHTGVGCMNMNCRNSPFDILKCPHFKQWRRDWKQQQQRARAIAEKREQVMKNYLKELWEE
jgi:hypothetical protein